MRFKMFVALMATAFALAPGCTMSSPVAAPAPKISENYEGIISRKDVRVLVVFGAGWCGHCRDLERDFKGLDTTGLAVCKVDVEERQDLKKRHNVSSFPTSIIFLNGEEISRKVGYEKSDYSEWLKQGGREQWKGSGK